MNKSLRIVFITQDDPFYLPKIFNYLLNQLENNNHVVIATILFDVSPFGKKEHILKQWFKTLRSYGLQFTIYYSLKYLIAKIKGQTIRKIHRINRTRLIRLSGSINSIDNIKLIQKLEADILISIAGNQIFRSPLFKTSKFGILNLHSALLPKYRGLMPSFWVLKNGEIETGVSVFFVDEGIDSGPILVQRKVQIRERSQEKLIWVLKFEGAKAIIESCNLLAKYGHNVVTMANNDEEMTYFSKPTIEDIQSFRKSGNHFF